MVSLQQFTPTLSASNVSFYRIGFYMAWHGMLMLMLLFHHNPPPQKQTQSQFGPKPNILLSLIIHIWVKRLTWLLKTFYHVEDQTQYQIQIQIQIQLLIPIWVKRLTCVLTTFDYGEDQTHWQSL